MGLGNAWNEAVGRKLLSFVCGLICGFLLVVAVKVIV